MNEAAEALEAAVNSAHKGTRWAFWVVVVSAGYLFARTAL